MSARIMTSMRMPRLVHTQADTSEQARRACAAFGLSIQIKSGSSKSRAIAPSREQLASILESSITLVHGASGAGKSRRLLGIEHALNEQGHTVHRVQQIADETTSLFDAFEGPIDQICATLAMGGLAEPRLWAMPISSLSTGERARFELARAIDRASQGDIVLADEFCSMLDRACAASLCATVCRWARRKNIRFVAAGAHEDLRNMLATDLEIDGRSGEHNAGSDAVRDPIRYEDGSMSDYDQLAHLHYLGNRPVMQTRVIRAIRTSPLIGEMLAGVLVVCMPTLNGVWRKLIWGDRYCPADKRLGAHRINQEIRRLSRVVVEPRSRGLGIASGLVRAYLGNPQTQYTEAFAAMGSVCPFLAHAGMREYSTPIPAANARLLDALNYLEIPATDLGQEEIAKNSLLHRELMHWARSSRMLRDVNTPAQTIALMASCRLLSRPRAYAWNSNGEHDEQSRDN